MTPAVEVVRTADVPHRIHEYAHSSDGGSYGLEAAEKLGIPASRVYKTLVAKLDGGSCCGDPAGFGHAAYEVAGEGFRRQEG